MVGAGDRVGPRDPHQADEARPRPARRHGARLPGRADAAEPEVDPRTIDRAIEIIRKRIDTLGVSEPEIQRVGDDPDRRRPARTSRTSSARPSEIGTTAQLYFYDWEPNVIAAGPRATRSATEQGFPRLIDAVKLRLEAEARSASRTAARPTARATTCSTRTRFELLAGPEQKKSDLYLDFPTRSSPTNTHRLAVPQGTVVVRRSRRATTRDTEADESETGPPEYFVLRDRPALSGTDITEPRAELRPERPTSRTSPSTSPTRAASVPGGHPGDRRARASPRRRRASPAPQADQFSRPLRGRARQRGRHRGRSSTSSRTRTGSTAAPGAQISGQLLDPGGPGPRREPAHRRAAGRAQADQPEHRLGDARPGGARPGPEGGGRRPRPGAALPARLLPLPRRWSRRSGSSSTRSSSSR